MKRFWIVSVLLLVALIRSPVFGQGTRADYERSKNLDSLAEDSVTHDRVNPHWTADGNAFWYQSHGKDGNYQFVWVDAITGAKRPAFDHFKLALALGNVMDHAVLPDCLPITNIEKETADSIVIDADGRRWSLNPANYALTPLPGQGAASPIQRLDAIQGGAYNEHQAKITFVNRTHVKLTADVVSPESKPVYVGDVWPMERHPVDSNTGAVWQLTDPAGKTVAIFKVVDDGGDAVIEPATRPATQPATASSNDSGSESSNDQVPSPDGKRVAIIRAYNIYVKDQKTGEETQMTWDGQESDGFYSTWSDIAWSPDSSRFVAIRSLIGQQRVIYAVRSSPSDQVWPKLESWYQDEAGDRVWQSKPNLFDVAARKEIPISDILFPNPYDCSIDDVHWEPDSRRFMFCYHQRGHQNIRVIAIDATTGRAVPIVDEHSNTFIDDTDFGKDGECKFFLQYLDDSGELIWMSERDGWNHLYLYDQRTGRVKNQITRGNWAVRGWDSDLDRVDAAKRQIWFRAGGLVPGEDPYDVHFCRINFDGSGLLDLTPADGTHALAYSPDGRFYIDTYSRVNLPNISELRRSADGALICALEKEDTSNLIGRGWIAPELFVAKGRDGKTDIYGVIYRPTNLNPARKYPIVEDIYASPDDTHVPHIFAVLDSFDSYLAELGFVVVKIDGMGTTDRSKAFHDVCWHNLADSGFPDRIPWIKAAAAKYPYMDLSRVGIYGSSAGGYEALRALESHGDFYKAAVADSGPQNLQMANEGWVEQWMGWPIGSWYAAQSNVQDADKITGSLLLVVGELDHTVDPSCTMQVVNRLVQDGKDFELLVLPNADHTEDGAYLYRRTNDFFVRHLLGVEPPVK